VRHLHRFINGVGEPKIIGGDDQAFQISAHFSRRLSVRTESGRIRPFPHAALQHVWVADHLADDRGNLIGSKIKVPVKRLHGFEDFRRAKVWIVKRRNLHAVLGD
jgi:hypothetical protein